MNLTFYGATREVTGSSHIISTQDDNILFDCGMFQGRRQEARAKNQSFSFDPRMVSNMLLSHAHIDHSGRIPLLVKKGLTGRIICSAATKDACKYLLLDSAHIQESDAAYLNYKTARKVLMDMNSSNKEKRDVKKALKKENHHLNIESIDKVIQDYRLERVEPLYTMKEAEQSLSHFESIPCRQSEDIGKHLSCTLYDAGHILGSTISVVRYKPPGRQITVAFTGDIGRFGKPIINDPTLQFNEEDRNIDLLIMESTYGNRFHEAAQNTKERLREVIERADKRGGSILIPAFAFGRTQEMLYLLHELYDEGVIPRLPVYVDSPLSSKITTVFGEHPELYDAETHDTFLKKGKNPFSFSQLKFIGSVEESMALNRDQSPHIVIASSGMCEAGRILHHLRHKIHNPQTTILIVGFMAEHTLGRRILEKGTEFKESGRKGKAPIQKILNKEYPLNAHVEFISGFSAHADQAELLRFLKESNLNIKRIAVVHGEEEQSTAFAEKLNQTGFQAIVPYSGQMVRV
ncbi:MAG: MBL fold metallo-hydrolase [SAR324 cluster bacterium]|nr:MBL fold metallo-hydrolase [SAR324 cluster bacterium]